MRIRELRHETPFAELSPVKGFGDVGDGAKVQGVMGVAFSGGPTDGTFPYYTSVGGKIDWITLIGLFGSVISPTALAADTDNWNPTNLSTAGVIRVDLSAAHNLTGIAAPAATGQRTAIILANISTYTLTLKHDVTSTAANRFSLPGAADLPLIQNTAVLLWYDATTARWRVGGGGGLGAFTGYVPGDFERVIEGGQSTIKAHGAMGATETIDPTDGNVHTGTLDASCTVTLAAPSGTGECTLEVWLTEDGTGGRTVSFAGSVTEQGTHDTTAGTTQRAIAETIDGGTNWVWTWIGGGVTGFAVPAISYGTPAAGVATTAIRTDATVTPPTEAQVTFTDITTNDVGIAKHGYTPKAPNDSSKYLDGTGAWSVPAGSGSSGIAFTVIGQEERVSDGSTTAWTLDNDFEENSVSARNLTTGHALSVTEGTSPSVTISAAGTAGDIIAFGYAASAL